MTALKYIYQPKSTDLSVDGGGRDLNVTHQALYGDDIRTPLVQMCGEAMS
jgi:hypothetical protein